MATDLSREELRRLARLGALSRLAELRQEEANIRAAFPDLFRGGRGKRVGAAAAPEAAAAPAKRARRRRKMSSAEKRAVSERMKRYWAERRKAR